MVTHRNKKNIYVHFCANYQSNERGPNKCFFAVFYF